MAKQNVYVGLFYDGSWHDITADVYQREGITIKRGKTAPLDVPAASTIDLLIGNRSGTYNPRNAMSPLYGKVGRNTPLMVGYSPVDEDWEDTTYNVTFANSGALPWARSTTQAHTGTWSMKSGAIAASQSSNLTVDVPAGANTLIFWIRTDTESTADQVGVFTAAGLQWYGSGLMGWTQVAIDVAGSTTVVFSYQKDATISVGADAVWIDDLRFINARGTGEIRRWSPGRTSDYDRTLGAASRGDAWTAVTVQGLLGRIAATRDPLRSALYRATINAVIVPAAYWPLEDRDGSTQAASGIGGAAMKPVTTVRYTLPDGTPLQPGGAPRFAQDGGVPGADKLVSLTDGGTLRAAVPRIADTGYSVDFVARFNPGAADGATTADIFSWRESGTYVHYTVNVTLTSVTVFHANAAADASLSFSGSATATVGVFDGSAHHFRYTVSQSGGNYVNQLYIDGNLMGTATNFVPPMAGTIGHPITIDANPGEDRGDYMPVAIGHITVWSTPTPPDMAAAAFGYPGETASRRLKRIGVEEGWAVQVRNDDDNTMPMGPQPIAAGYDMVGEIERSEGGLIYDQRGGIGIVLRTRNSQYAQAARLQLSGTDGSVRDGEPDLDNVGVMNDVTVTQRNGASVNVVRDSGPLSVLPPPSGIGREQDEIAVNVDTTTISLTDIAGWWLNRGTIDEERYPSITVDLDAAPALVAAASAVEAGDRITVSGLVADLVDLRVLGIEETIGGFRRLITFKCEPYATWNVGLYDNTTMRYDSASTTVGVAVTNVGTSVIFSTTDPRETWSTTETPYDVFVAGQRNTVTVMGAATGSGPYVQTATVTRGVNGVTKALAAGEPITIATPGRYAQ